MSKDTGRSAKRQSVLVDLYNLELSDPNPKSPGIPIEDRPKILQFFRKHAPEVTICETAKEISSPGQTLEPQPKPAKIVKFNVNEPFTPGTLGIFEFFEGKSWFDDWDTVNFKGIYKLVHEVVDNYVSGKEIPRRLIAWVSSLTERVTIGLVVKSPDGKRLGPVTVPDSLDRRNYSFSQTIFQHSTISHSADGRTKSPLNLAGMKFRLFREILSLWNGDIEIRRCAFEGGKRNPPCEKIFIAGNRKRYCSKKCYDKARRLRRFEKTGF